MVYSCPFSKDSERNVPSPQDSLAMRSRTTKATAFLVHTLCRASEKTVSRIKCSLDCYGIDSDFGSETSS